MQGWRPPIIGNFWNFLQLSKPHIGPYPVVNMYKNLTIQLQKGIVSEPVHI
jgi:hypothetical protein